MTTSSLVKAAAAASAFAVMASSGAMLANSFKSRTEMQEYLCGLVVDALRYGSTTMVINELCGGDQPNQVFKDAKVYTTTRMSSSTNSIRIFKHEKDADLTFYVEDIVFTDTFEGVKLRWILRCHRINSTRLLRYYELTFPKKAMEMVIGSYLPFVSREAASTRRQRMMKLFSIGDEAEKWMSVTLNHPSTFQTLALDPLVKKFITDDLDRFVEKGIRVRVYLLYGPTGTGKSSLVAAMANHLKADVYGLNLNQVSSSSQLQRLLMETTNSSILLVEDIDCLPEFKKRSFEQVDETQVTLSGLLDFMDRGWSSNFGDQRIIVLTATDKEKLGSAFLRAGGRIDVHIHMPYCTPDAFEILASNHLNITTHELFDEIKESILEIEVSPAEVAQQLMMGCGSVNNVLERLVEFLAAKKVEKGKALE